MNNAQYYFFTLCFFLLANTFVIGQPFSSSKLPIIVIETNGQNVPNEPKIEVQMGIIDNGPGNTNQITDPFNAYNGTIGIEVRGASSSNMPQKPYAIETRDEFGNDRTVSLFGMPEESDWCLIPHYNEKTFARNPLSYHLFREMGRYAPRTQLVEVVVNGNYEGIYLFCERIKRDKNRVDIKKANPDSLSGDALTGGYIFKIDYWNNADKITSAFSPSGTNVEINYAVHYPKVGDLTSTQRAYLGQYIFEAESALFLPDFTDPQLGYRRYFDAESFVDYFLLNELARNNDGSKKSRYFHKNRNSEDSTIHAGPVWDFDWAWKDIPECNIFGATDGSGWSYRINDCGPDIYAPDLYPRMLQDSEFADLVCARYAELRQNIFSKEYLFDYLDSIALLVQDAQVRHYQRWQILGYGNWTPEVGAYPTTYQGEVEKLKGWIERRLTWLDANVPKLCASSSTTPDPVPVAIKVFPNPTDGWVVWNGFVPLSRTFYCSDALGRVFELPMQLAQNRASFDLRGLPAGVYFVWGDGSKGDAVKVVKY
jgi:hypothetical protein